MVVVLHVKKVIFFPGIISLTGARHTPRPRFFKIQCNNIFPSTASTPALRDYTLYLLVQWLLAAWQLIEDGRQTRQDLVQLN